MTIKKVIEMDSISLYQCALLYFNYFISPFPEITCICLSNLSIKETTEIGQYIFNFDL